MKKISHMYRCVLLTKRTATADLCHCRLLSACYLVRFILQGLVLQALLSSLLLNFGIEVQAYVILGMFCTNVRMTGAPSDTGSSGISYNITHASVIIELLDHFFGLLSWYCTERRTNPKGAQPYGASRCTRTCDLCDVTTKFDQ